MNPQADETVSKKVARYFRVQYPDLYFSHNVVINANPLWALVNKRDNTGEEAQAGTKMQDARTHSLSYMGRASKGNPSCIRRGCGLKTFRGAFQDDIPAGGSFVKLGGKTDRIGQVQRGDTKFSPCFHPLGLLQLTSWTRWQ